MSSRTTSRVSLAALIAAALTAAPGCSSGPDAAATAESMDRFTLETAKVNDAIDQAVQALKSLVEAPGDSLKGSFEAYARSVAAIESQAAIVRARGDEMKARGAEFFKDWEAGTGTGLTPERQTQLNVAYGKIQEQTLAAREAFVPFLASLKDIQSLLALELTPRGLEGVAPLVPKAQTNAADVKARIAAVMEQTNAVRGLLMTKPAS